MLVVAALASRPFPGSRMAVAMSCRAGAAADGRRGGGCTWKRPGLASTISPLPSSLIRLPASAVLQPVQLLQVRRSCKRRGARCSGVPTAARLEQEADCATLECSLPHCQEGAAGAPAQAARGRQISGRQRSAGAGAALGATEGLPWAFVRCRNLCLAAGSPPSHRCQQLRRMELLGELLPACCCCPLASRCL